ncbi:14-3-3 protein 6-like protein, partial [Tanacetum coccineum]
MASCIADREEHLCMAKLAEQVGRYDDMMNSMTKYVSELSATEELTEEEFTLLCTAYRKVLEPRRASWRRIYSIEQKEELHGNNEHAKMAKESRCRIEGEISEICHGLLKLLDEKVLAGTKCFGQSKVVYLTMKGDYYRYLAEVKAGDER